METALAELELDYTSLGASFSGTVSALVNQLLRCLGHLADLQALQRSIESLFLSRPFDLATRTTSI
jgi:hypothetical protein